MVVQNMEQTSEKALDNGLRVIGNYVHNLPNLPGVYRMLGEEGRVLYVGKAKDLKRRVGSYMRKGNLSQRLKNMVAATRAMEITETPTPELALLLEADLIKSLKPYYNVILRDDKSYPEILIRGDHPVSQITKHRGPHRKKGVYFGPFTDVSALNKTLSIMQRVFLLRTCNDTIFSNRSRPCLQYQIKRCSAPCVVGYISKEKYQRSVENAILFLKGRSKHLLRTLHDSMQQASIAHDYEKAATFRDAISALTKVTDQHYIQMASTFSADIFVVEKESCKAVVQGFFYRLGRNCGTHTFFLQIEKHTSRAEILSAFLCQFYCRHPIPKKIYTSVLIEDRQEIETMIGTVAGGKTRILCPRTGKGKRIVESASFAAKSALVRTVKTPSRGDMLILLAQILGIQRPIRRIEIFDNSHIQGNCAVGVMVVANREGFDPKRYQRWSFAGQKKSIEGKRKGGHRAFKSGYNKQDFDSRDDFSMMREVFFRRFQKSPSDKKLHYPDLILIDGGKGHIRTILTAMETLEADFIPIISMAKGKNRHSGEEKIYFYERSIASIQTVTAIGPRSALHHYLQTLRDEAHRFAITSHRKNRNSTLLQSFLDDIRGIGASRKKYLLQAFGSTKNIAKMDTETLGAVKGISPNLAQKIYDHFHP